ncbi:hypothetical protein [Streptomyces ossamyceticus]|uniref:Helix-turn-helix protein n=1 Tax=Streptomyces ossamyceticus TaxID=249581 RepID=A0ABV2V295_9ACTN
MAAATRSMTDAFPVSRETIRRLLRGESVARWERVDAVLRALCEIGNQDPDRRRWQESGDWNDDGDPTTCRQHLRQLLYDDIDEVQPEQHSGPSAVPPPRSSGGWGSTPPASTGGWGSSPSQPKQDDPWATTPPPSTPSTGGYTDEPPF